jgi:group II intron reverse transcriptase/maturase
MQEILESIYDPNFLPCSYGFRPGKSCHNAIKELQRHLYDKIVDIVIDVDLANFFGTIDHKILKDMLSWKIKDTKFLRYISRMFKAGVLSQGELKVTDEGVPQGSCCSPILSNIFAHYVIDVWLEETVKPRISGEIRSFRYADDLVICCKYSKDATRIKDVLSKRLAKYKLQLNADKTKMVKFSKRRVRRGGKEETFDFLGFTFYYGKSLQGYRIPMLKTSGKRYRSKLKRVTEWARQVKDKQPLMEIWKMFCSKLRGHAQYYSVSFNTRNVDKFMQEAKQILFKWLNRRSQRKSFNWEQFKVFFTKYPLPNAKLHHNLVGSNGRVNKVVLNPLP